jgi:hypothetical protein
MASEVSICNQALSWLGGNKIISLNDDTVEASLCKANYTQLRDAVLEEGKWTFATRRYQLPRSATPPAYGYSYAFEIPPEILTVISATRNADNKNRTDDLDWRREEGRILCDSATLYCKAIVRIIDPTKFTPMFVQALAARLAADICMTLTESTTKEANMWGKYNSLIDAAFTIDGMQGKSDRIRSNSQILKRR